MSQRAFSSYQESRQRCHRPHINVKNSINDKKQYQCQNGACEQKTTNEKRNFGSNKKLGLERTTDGLEKPFRKKSHQENKKTVKIQVKLPHVNH